jgi:hypothetical protein
MIPTNVLIVFAIVIGGFWFATQWTADALGYQLRLGAPWFIAAGLPIYYPWRLIEWWYAYDAYAPLVVPLSGQSIKEALATDSSLEDFFKAEIRLHGVCGPNPTKSFSQCVNGSWSDQVSPEILMKMTARRGDIRSRVEIDSLLTAVVRSWRNGFATSE